METRRLSILVATLLLPMVAAQADDSRVRNELAAWYARFSAAQKKQDVKALARLCTDNYAVVLQNGRTLNRQEAVEQWKRQFSTGTGTVEPLGVRIEQLQVNGDTAVARVRATLSWTSKGPGPRHTGRMIVPAEDTFVRTPGGWKLRRGVQLPGAQIFRDGKPFAPPSLRSR